MTDENETTTASQHLTSSLLVFHAIATDEERGLIFGAIVGAHAAAFGMTPRQLLTGAIAVVPDDETWVGSMKANAERKIRNARRQFARATIELEPKRPQG